MFKSIKKSIKYLIILIGIILLVPSFFYLVIQIPDVQTFIVNRITAHFSDQIKSTIVVGRFEYSFFNKLILNDVLIKDQNNDTLIYSQRINAGIRRLDFRKNNIRLGKVDITRPYVSLITDTTGLMNLAWYLNMLSDNDSTGQKSKTFFSIDHIVISDGNFKLHDKRKEENTDGIDFNNLQIHQLNGEVTDFRVFDDSTSFSVRDLIFSELKGFIVQQLSSDVIIASNDIIFNNLLVNTGKSIINAEQFSMMADSSNAYGAFTEMVKLDLKLNKSLISSSDVQYFIPVLKGSDEPVELSGKVSGTISELKGRDIILTYGDNTYLDCDFDFSGLPVFEDAFIYIGVNHLKTKATDFEKLEIPGKGKIKIPDILNKLGNVTFSGSFTGFVSDFVTYGRIGTESGSLKTDISVRPDKDKRFKIKGLIAGSNIDLGYLLDKKELFGKASMETSVDGYASSFKKIEGNLTGKIDSIEINRYKYRNIALNGLLAEKTWDGNINITDANIKMDLMGLFDFSDTIPEFDFTLNLKESNLYKLNFDKADTTSGLSMLLTANFRGNNIDNLLGEIKLINSTLRKHGKNLELYNFSLKALSENNKPAISLRTDFLDADIRGYYNFSQLDYVYKSALASLMPTRYLKPVTKKDQYKNDFSFAINFKNTDKINNFFRTGILIADKSTVAGGIHPDNIIRLEIRSKMLTIRQNTFSNLTVDAGCLGGKLNADLKSSSLSVLGQSDLKGFTINMSTIPDNFLFSLFWDNKDKILNKGVFSARGSVSKQAAGNPLLIIDIDSSEIYSKNNLWKIHKSAITVDTTAVNFDNLMISNRGNYYLIDGIISEKESDSLKLEFNGIELSPLNHIGEKNNTNGSRFNYNVKGTLYGEILLSNVLKSPLIISDLKIKGFSLLSGDYGDITIISSWNSSRKVAEINAKNNLNGVRNMDVKGIYDPKSRIFNINALTSKLPVDALNPLLSFFASDIRGSVSGKVNLRGERDKLILTGAVLAENTSLRIDYLHTKYKLNDTIRFDKNGIKFRNVRVTDEKGNYATISGSVNHNSFKDFTTDLIINMNDCLVLNTQAKDNELFYGTAYATGVTTIKTGPNLLSFDISARTRKNTRFFIPLNSGLSVSEHSFVTFVVPDTVKTKEGVRSGNKPSQQSSGSGLELNFDLDVNPEAEVQLLIDPKAGDVIKGRGSGKLNINLDKKGVFKISGDYSIDEGEYLFTLGNLLNKRFDVEDGGRITFNGDVKDAEIDLQAKYRNLKTSLYPIIPEERYNERIPVEPQLNLSGKLFNPVVGLNIYLPNADEETRSLFKNSISTEEELSRQFLYLLVMNSFYQDPAQGSATASTTSTGTSAMAVTTTEMLSNQLSNWLSQIYNDFDIGFVYRPGNKDINSQELQVALSTQLLNDKVVVNGNFDFRGPNNSYGNPITGDFDVEYKITERVRFKVFNRFNNPYTGRGAPYTQGLGLFYKQDFNNLFKSPQKKEQSEMKKEDEVTIK
jgi:hypothetical protein